MKSFLCQYNYYYLDRKTQNKGGCIHVITYFALNERIYPGFNKIIKVFGTMTL